MTRKFDLTHSPLAGGRTLIEASAGTGKTYTIAGLLLRLIVEQGLGIEQILVTTYTELATAELRDRIRRLLRQSLDDFNHGQSENDVINALITRTDPKVARERLQTALQSFDDAAIYTIHGFCQRMLKDQSFESGGLFDLELVTDQSSILREIVDDFWRSRFYSSHPLFAGAAEASGLTPRVLERDLEDVVNRPTINVIPPASGDLDHVYRELLATWKQAQDCWLREQPQIRAIFERPSWANRPYNLPEKVMVHLTELDQLWSTTPGKIHWSKSFSFFTTSEIQKGTSKRSSSPTHSFFDYCETLCSWEKKLSVQLRSEFLSWARTEMKRRKLHRNVVFFDDLLSRLHESLVGEGGHQLARSIRNRFRAVLIDEFQDTDPIQYAIFDRIYSQDEAPLFLIGDPKQAIYAFRGADVFTYIAAARTAKQRYTLPTNWRSESDLVRATNTLFRLRSDAFVFPDILFQSVEPAGEADKNPFLSKGTKEPPLQLWLASNSEPITNKSAERALPGIVASAIVSLLRSQTRIGPEKLAPPNIAVIVSTNREAQMMQEALLARNVAAVIYSATNVFESQEAKELLTLLSAVVEPAHERKLRAALATETLGLTSIGLEELSLDEPGWEKRLLDFHRYHALWREKGFIQMLRTLVVEQEVRPRLLAYVDGERRLTNLLHLAELLHRMCVELRLGMSGVIKHLREEMVRKDNFHPEEYELRLERDQDAVRIITVHKSKGLEYDVVFCPFAWKNPWFGRDRNVIFHADGQLVLDLERSKESELAQKSEGLADQVRLLYVALTRARHRSYLVWGNFSNGQESAVAHLLGKWPERGVNDVKAEPTIAASELPTASNQSYQPKRVTLPELEARQFNRVLDHSYGIGSFSRMITGHDLEPRTQDDELFEDDAAEVAEVEPETAATGMFAFPRGTGPGTCLHQILEQMDFTNLTDLPEVAGERLGAFGLREFESDVCEMVRKVVSVPLEIDQHGFTLSRVPKARRLPELEFYFSIGKVSADQLVALLGEPRLRLHTMSGFMKGYIDLVFEDQGRFHIVDWKSNWLGPELKFYDATALEAEMKRNFYNIQSYIYSIALHRFLRIRLANYSYETHFGGVYYIFLRGVDPVRPEFGIHRARPSARLIEELDHLLGHDH